MDVLKAAIYACLLVAGCGANKGMAQILKCVEPVTGTVTFSDGGCSEGEEAAAVDVRPVNSIEGSQYRQENLDAAQPSELDGSRSITVVGGDDDSQSELKSLCSRARNHQEGARGLTVVQRAIAQRCLGMPSDVLRSEEAGGTSASSSSSPKAPPELVNCDAGGCWDTNGARYNRGAGSTFMPAEGGAACQYMGGILVCP